MCVCMCEYIASVLHIFHFLHYGWVAALWYVCLRACVCERLKIGKRKSLCNFRAAARLFDFVPGPIGIGETRGPVRQLLGTGTDIAHSFSASLSRSLGQCRRAVSFARAHTSAVALCGFATVPVAALVCVCEAALPCVYATGACVCACLRCLFQAQSSSPSSARSHLDNLLRVVHQSGSSVWCVVAHGIKTLTSCKRLFSQAKGYIRCRVSGFGF